MVLENFSQNKCRSETNVSKNNPKPCASNTSERRVKKLIQKYEDLNVSAKNINLQSAYRHSSCGEYVYAKHSEMLSDTSISLNRNTVSRFLSLENDKYVINEYKKNDNKPSSDVKNNCDIVKMPSHSKKSSKSNYKYVDESERDKKQNSTTPSSAKRKDDIWKIFTPFNETDKDKKNDNHRTLSTKKENKYGNIDKDRQYCSSLPSKKKQENSFGKNFIRSFSATTSRDKKPKPVSSSNEKDNKLKPATKDGHTIAKQNTGAIKKQENLDDITYRKRRNSYLMATQNDENHRKLKIYPEEKKQSHVSKTISKFETEFMTVVDVTTRTSAKFEQEIKQLFQQYHDNKKFGTSNKMTREELSLEIDNVLLNKFKQISQDSTPDVCHTTIENNTNKETIHETPNQTLNNIETEYVIIMRESASANEMSTVDDIGQGRDEVNLDFDKQINIREQLTTELNRVLSADSVKGSVENLCEDLEKAISSSLTPDVEVKSICVTLESESDEDNSFENIAKTVNSYLHETEHIYQNFSKTEEMQPKKEVYEPKIKCGTEHIYVNLQYIQEQIHNTNQTENNSQEQLDPIDFKSKIKVFETNAQSAPEQIYENLQNIQEQIHKTEQETNNSQELLDPVNLKSKIKVFEINAQSAPEQIYENLQNIQEQIHKTEQETNDSQELLDPVNLKSKIKVFEINEQSEPEQINENIQNNTNQDENNSPEEIEQSLLEENNLDDVVLRDPDGTKPKRKVSNLVSYFSDKIAEISTAATVERKTSFSKTRKESYNDDVFTPPPSEKVQEVSYSRMPTLEVQNDVFNQEFSADSFSSDSSYEENSTINGKLYEEAQNINILHNVPEFEKQLSSPGVRITCLDDALSKKTELPVNQEDILNNQAPRDSSLYRNKSFNSTTSSDDFGNISIKYKNKPPVHEQTIVLQEEPNMANQNEKITEQKPRFSRLYSGKFSRHNSTITKIPDTNNNSKININNEQLITTNETNNTEVKNNNESLNTSIETNNTERINDNVIDNDAQIFQQIQDDKEFLSDSDGDYDIREAFNYNSKFISLQRKLSTSDWVENTVQQFKNIRSKSYDDFDTDEDTEHIYDKIKRSGSQGTLCTIYDEQNNPTIRMSMMDITGDIGDQVQKQSIEKSQRELKKNIEEIQDNSKKACLINELISSEKYYINTSLHRIVLDYMPEVNKENISNYPKGLIGKSRQIFGNADLLYEEHKYKFLPQLEKHTTIDELATCFLKHETLFKLYPLYSKNKPKSEVVMREYGAYFKAKQDELNDKLDLPSYLLSPIQRLAKYCLLLKSLVKECEKEENNTQEHKIGLEKLKSALELVNKQMRMGNDLIALDSVVGYNGNIREHGEVLLRDNFMVQPPSKKGQAYEGMIFLFQDCLLITAINRQDHQEIFVYKESFQLTDMGYSDLDTEPLEFCIWFRKRDNNNYRFRTKNQELKQKWVKEIFNLLWKQLEANKRRRKKELEENGVKDTRVPVAPSRPYSVPNKGKESPSTGYSTKTRKRTLNSSSTDTIWYTK